jgi:hypothetical protein
MLHVLTLALLRPRAEEPAAAWQRTAQTSLDTLAVRNPGNTPETCLAIPFIALGTGTLDAGGLAFGPATAQAHRHRAGAAALTRTMTGANRLLAAQCLQPATPECDWGDTAAHQAALSQATAVPSPEATRSCKADAQPEVPVGSNRHVDRRERSPRGC